MATAPPFGFWDFDGMGMNITITLVFPNDMNIDVLPLITAIAVDFDGAPFTIDTIEWVDTHQLLLTGASMAPPFPPPVNVVLAIFDRDLRLVFGFAQSPFAIVVGP